MKATISRLDHVAKAKIAALHNAIPGEPRLRISSYPYLSGDLFLALADVAVIRERIEPVRLRNGNLIRQ